MSTFTKYMVCEGARTLDILAVIVISAGVNVLTGYLDNAGINWNKLICGLFLCGSGISTSFGAAINNDLYRAARDRQQRMQEGVLATHVDELLLEPSVATLAGTVHRRLILAFVLFVAAAISFSIPSAMDDGSPDQHASANIPFKSGPQKGATENGT